MHVYDRSLTIALAGLLAACVTADERGTRAALARASETLADVPVTSADAPLGDDWAGAGAGEDADGAPRFDGSAQDYVDYALVHHHGLRASWERWRAASHRVARERRLPMPSLTYTVFVRQVETRVGPQRHKLGVRQRFPWPGELLAGADAAATEARAMQRVFEAEALEVRARVVHAYWRLWLIRVTREVEREQLELYGAVAELARGRLEVGKASLADIQQIDLARARLADAIDGLGEAEREASARLIAAVAAPPGTPTPTLEAEPVLELPSEDETKLRAALVDNPRLDRWTLKAEASEHRVREARSARAPDLAVGVDWIEVGPARAAGVPDSGKDALMISVGLELPLWQSNYAQDQRAAEAEASAARSEWAAARDLAAADLSAALAQIRDTARRAELHAKTLVPQAQGALESTLGGYAVGEGDLAAILIAERDLLELRLAGIRVQAEHAVAWAELERVVGRSVDAAAPAADAPVDRQGPGDSP